MSPTNVKISPSSSRAGFTLVELIVATTLSALIFAAVFSGFTFLGRNLTRLVNSQEQEAKTHHAYSLFGQDISTASGVYAGTDSTLSLTIPTPDPTRTTEPSVVYVYQADPQGLASTEPKGTLTRKTRTKLSSSAPIVESTSTLMLNLRSFNFKYYNQAGVQLALTASDDNVDLSKSSPSSVKEIELSFTTAMGNLAGGTQSMYAGASPRFVLRNKALLQ